MNEEKRTPKPLTNGDRIRAMSNEDLAEFFCGRLSCDLCPANFNCVKGNIFTCYNSLHDWLNSPVENEVNHE